MRSHFVSTAAVVCAVTGASSLLTGVCSAQPLTAADYATNSAYADGLQPGDNGGFGFTAWSMYGTYNSAIQYTMDTNSVYNPLGVAWTLFNPNGRTPGPPFPADDSSNPPEGGSDIVRAGRGFSPLRVGQTISTIIANPTERR